MSTILLTAAEAVVRFLAAQRAESPQGAVPLFGGVFAIFGHGNVAGLGEALYRHREALPTLRAHNEQGMAHAAIAYAKAHMRRRMMAVTTSVGPGATNLVTAIADAWMDSTPLVCITGQVRSNLIGTDAFQEIDITGITLPIVKHSWLVQDVRELPAVMKAAFHIAQTGRCGPVLVDVAKDVQEAELDFSYPD